MMRLIVESSLKYRFLIIAIAAALVYFGLKKVDDLPVDVFPEFAPPLVEIQTISIGLSPKEVEALVTVPLEQALNGIPDLDVMRSKSVPQLSSIKLIFKPGTDILLARQLVAERVQTVTPSLPTWAAPPYMLPPLSATSRCMKIGISSESRNLMELSMIAYWKIRASLLGVKGVANVAIWGERIQMMQVQVVPDLLKIHHVTLDEVMKATADALDAGLLFFSNGAMIGTGGFIETPNQRLGIRHILSIVRPEDMSKVVVTKRNGKPVYLSDVARVLEDHQPLIGDAIINDGPGLMLIVEKFPWGNTMEITKGVEDELAKLQPGLEGIDIDSHIFRPATFIEMATNNLTNALIIGCILVIIVLFVFLYEWRVALISLLAIPLSLISAMFVLYLYGATINTMILAGFVIALGAVVDDAIVGIENIVRRLRQARKEGSNKSMAKIILDASIEVRQAIIYSTLIEAVVLVPVFVMGGLSGAFFQPLALSYILAVVASTIVALTVTPAMGMILLRNAPLDRRETSFIRIMKSAYISILQRIIKTPLPAYSIVGIIVLAGMLVLPKLGQELLPSFKERDFLMHWVTKPGTSHPEMNRITIAASKELRSIDGVRNFGAHIGQALLMDEVVGVNFGENWISVDPSVDYDETIASIQKVVDGYPGLYRDLLTYLKERIREVLTGSHEAITVRIYGPELGVLREKAEEIRELLTEIDGTVDIHVGLQVEVPQIEVEVNLDAARRYGLKPGDIRRAAATLVAGEEVGDIFRGGKAYDVQVWSIPEARNSLSSIQNLMINTPDGGFVLMKDVADIRLVPTPNIIKRDNLSRRIDIGANVKGKDLGSVADDVEERLQEINFPLGYHPELIGEYAERQAVQKRMLFFVIAALIIIFLLLYTSFKSSRLAALAYMILPAAMVGGVLAAYFGSGIVSLGSIVGFLTVLGIAARNGILMINHFQHLEQFEGETFGPKLVLRGAKERLVPIMMTATTTALALLPLVVAGTIPGNEIEHPMAIVIFGGLITATLLNLFVLPSLYLRFAPNRKTKTSNHLSA